YESDSYRRWLNISLHDALPISHNQERANESAEKHTLLESIISSDIKAPVIEEIIFRGLLFLVVVVVSNLISNNANKRIVNIVFIITSGIIFRSEENTSEVQ